MIVSKLGKKVKDIISKRGKSCDAGLKATQTMTDPPSDCRAPSKVEDAQIQSFEA